MSKGKDIFIEELENIIERLMDGEIHALVLTWRDGEGIGQVSGGCAECGDKLRGYRAKGLVTVHDENGPVTVN